MLLPIVSLALQARLPSAPEAIRRSQKAYDSVRTFEQESTGHGVGYMGTAHVWFSRPARLKVSGVTIFGAKYDLVSEGASLWLFSNGSWRKMENAGRGIASITGISANAGTLAPAMLTHSVWGSLMPEIAGNWTVASESVKGRRLLRMHGTTPYLSTTWLDAKTYFVVRTETAFAGHTIKVDFSPPKIDVPIPGSRFKR